MPKYFSLFLTAIWPGLGHIFLKKPLGFVYFFIWVYVLSRFLQVFPDSAVMGSEQQMLIQTVVGFGGVLVVWLGLMADNFQIVQKGKINSSFLLIVPFISLIIFYIFLYMPYRSRPLTLLKGPTSVGNLHTHTNCSDGLGSYEQVIKRAKELGFDFIAITDHNFVNYSFYNEETKVNNDTSCMDALEKCKNETRLLCIPSQEVSRGGPHILAIGINKEINYLDIENRASKIKTVVDEIHNQGGLAIAAHPMPFGQGGQWVFSEGELINNNFDAMECEKSNWQQNRRQYEISKQHNIPCVYNSDAHPLGALRTVYNVCEAKIKTLEDLKKAIKNNRCRQFFPLDSWFVNLTSYL